MMDMYRILYNLQKVYHILCIKTGHVQDIVYCYVNVCVALCYIVIGTCTG